MNQYNNPMTKEEKRMLFEKNVNEKYTESMRKVKLAVLRDAYKTANKEKRVDILKQVEIIENTIYKLYEKT